MTPSLDLSSCLALIPDRRRAEGKMYSQVGVILFSIIALLSGARSYRQIHALIHNRLALLNAAFPAAALRRAPAYTSVRGILQQIDPDDLEKAFRRHAKHLDEVGDAGAGCSGPSRFIAIDGKTLRQSFDAFADRKAAHVLSAFAVDHQIILGHEVIDEKSNEIPAAQALIAALGVKRTGVHARRHALPKKTFEVARKTGNDLIVQVKGNQKGLLHNAEGIVVATAPIDVDQQRNRARNRQEDRLVEVYAPGSALEAGEWGPLVAAVARVTRRTLIRSASTGLWKSREETAFYVSSTTLSAATFANAIRNHWAIENQNHWVRDVTVAEDASRIRVNPGIMARLRNQVLNIARANGVTNLAEALWAAAIDPAISLSYGGV